MDVVKFTQLVSYLSVVTNTYFSSDQIEAIKGTIDQMTNIKFEPATHEQIKEAAGNQVMEMLRAMHDGKKIEAIKACRMLTGYGLKEAKDAIEWAMAPRN